jgi:uncharacterized protein (TIGR02265 family)
VLPEGIKLEPPDFDAPLDGEAVCASVPPHALIKGFFVESFEKIVLAERPDLEGKLYDGLPRKSYQPFRSYHRGEVMRVEMHFSQLMFPNVGLRQALRMACHRVYPTFLNSLVGRVVLVSLFGNDVDAVLKVGPKMFSAVTNFGHVDAQRVGEKHWVYHYRDYYSWLDSGDVGVIEGLLQHYKVEGELKIYKPGPWEMWLDIQWR